MMKGIAHILIASAIITPALALPPRLVSPKPGALESYRDWTIGCDNGGRCEAVSLVRENESFDQGINLMISRDPEAVAQPEITLRSRDTVLGTLAVMIDGKLIARGPAIKDAVTIAGAQGAALAIAMARGTKMDVRQGNRSIGTPSLAGLAAALRYMDARQGRAGTVTALIATGPLGVRAVKAPPALPVIRRIVVPTTGTPVALWREERVRLFKQTGCDEEIDTDREAELYPLSKTQTLVLLPCGAGAYNLSSAALIATGQPGRRVFATARFDMRPGWGEAGSPPMLVNAGWDAAASRLSSYAKGRGIGDCGSSETYVWDGAMFRLVEAVSMGECRGAWDWITTWRAKVVE